MRKELASSIWVPVEAEKTYREPAKLRNAGRVHKWRYVSSYRSTRSGKAGHHDLASKGGDLIFKVAKTKSGNAFVALKEGHVESRCAVSKREARKTSASTMASRIRSRSEGFSERVKAGLRYEGLIEKVGKGSFDHRIFSGVLEARWGVAPTLDVKYEAPKLEHYKGVVKGRQDDSVLVTVSSPGDWDRWEARIPLASFDKFPEEGKEFSCIISISGPDISVRAKILPERPPRSLKDFGIDKEELLDWASKIDL